MSLILTIITTGYDGSFKINYTFIKKHTYCVCIMNYRVANNKIYLSKSVVKFMTQLAGHIKMLH